MNLFRLPFGLSRVLVAVGFALPGFARAADAPNHVSDVLLRSANLADFAVKSAAGSGKYSDLKIPSENGLPGGAREIHAAGSGQGWNVELKHPVAAAIANGDVLLLRFRLRTTSVNVESGEGEVMVYLQRGRPDWEKIYATVDTAGSGWKSFAHAFVADRDFAAGEAELGFGLDLLPQTIQLADVEVLRFPRGTPLSSLPAIHSGYEGREPDAAWRASAETRIKLLRQGDLHIEIRDTKGRPVTGARVESLQLSHVFHFGTAVVPRRFVTKDADSVAYRAAFLSLFNGAVPENELKWVALAGDFGPVLGDLDTTLRGLTWVRAHNAEVRGHVLVWPGWKNLPASLCALRDDPDALRRAVLDHIASVASSTRDITCEWDVLNEPYANHDLMDILGRDAMIDWFRAARTALPDQRLYLNDYGILSGGGLNRAKLDAYLDTVRYLREGGAPLGGLGLQGHFGADLTPPARLLAVLDRVAETGLPIRVTEFDVDIGDEQLQADYTRDFYTLLFSHPAVNGIYTWGFWEKNHWRPRAAYFRADWSEKPNGRALRELIHERWWSHLTGETDTAGCYSDRVFAGRHRVTATLGARRVEAEVDVPARGEVTLRLVLPD